MIRSVDVAARFDRRGQREAVVVDWVLGAFGCALGLSVLLIGVHLICRAVLM